VTLTKRGHYTLRGGDAPTTPDTLRRARYIVMTASLLAGLLCIGHIVLAPHLPSLGPIRGAESQERQVKG